jgi:hypothetical protein
LKAQHRLWPTGWWPDQRTLGLLIFGFFGVSSLTALAFFGTELSQMLNLQSPNEVSYSPPWVRVTSGATLVGGIAEVVAAFGGLALMANLPRARVITSLGVAATAATGLLTLVVAPFGFSYPAVGSMVLDVAIVVFVMRWQPQRASGMPSVVSESAAVDGGSGATRY